VRVTTIRQDGDMPAALSDLARRLLDRPTIVTLTTIRADGSPHSTPVWAARDGDDVLISTVVGRAKDRHMRRDPRVSVSCFDPDDPIRYVTVEGRASLTTDGGPQLIQTLSQKYDGTPFSADEGTDRVRVVVRVRPERVISR
jgi:PPOX class probable F420-dependent enzyme